MTVILPNHTAIGSPDRLVERDQQQAGDGHAHADLRVAALPVGLEQPVLDDDRRRRRRHRHLHPQASL